jgi:acetyl-CoA carboxylase carboxyltransferase component
MRKAPALFLQNRRGFMIGKNKAAGYLFGFARSASRIL